MRDEVAITLGVMFTADCFLNKKHAANIGTVLPKSLQYLGSTLGIARSDLAEASPKLGSLMKEYLGSPGSEAGSRGSGKRKGKDEEGAEPKAAPKRRVREKQPEKPENGGKRKRKSKSEAKGDDE